MTHCRDGLSLERSQYPYSVRRELDVRLSNIASELMSLRCHTIGQYNAILFIHHNTPMNNWYINEPLLLVLMIGAP